MLCGQNMLKIVLIYFWWKTFSYSVPADVIVYISLLYSGTEVTQLLYILSLESLLCIILTFRQDWDLIMLFLQSMSLFDLLSSWTVVLMQSPCVNWNVMEVTGLFLEIFLLRTVLYSGFSLLASNSRCWRENQTTAVLLGSCLNWKPMWYRSMFTNTTGASIINLGRNVTMLKNIPELVSSYAIEGLLEINETSLQTLQTCQAWLWWNSLIVPEQHSVVG